MDIIWAYLRQLFPLLSKIELSVLPIPHSNAAEERVFSMIKKTKTEFKANIRFNNANRHAVYTIKNILRLRLQATRN